jgi:flagellar hook-associated protein 2
VGVLKIGGLVSGLDTENLISSLMSIEKRPVVAMQTQTDDLNTQARAWRDTNSRLLTLQNRLTDLVGLTDATWTAKKATATDASVLNVTTTSSSAVPGSYAVDVVALASATTWQSGLMGTGPVADPAAALGLSGTLQVATGLHTGQTITINATDSLNTIVSTINQNSTNLGFTASALQVNPGDYRLVLSGSAGSTQDFSLQDSVGSAGAALMITDMTATKTATASNGMIKVNGLTVTTAGNSVQDAIPGTTMNLTKVGSAQVNVTNDSQRVLDAVKGFISQYNSVIDFVSSETAYDPQTKSKGTLFGESRMSDLQGSLSGVFVNTVAGLPASTGNLAMVGIGTEAFQKGGKVTGKLVIDETKFMAALKNDPDSVKRLFTANDTSQGVIVRAQAFLNNFTGTGGIMLGQASAIDSQVKLLSSRIDDYNLRILPARETLLRNQFTGLEKAMAKYQSQGSWLSSQLSSMVGSK